MNEWKELDVVDLDMPPRRLRWGCPHCGGGVMRLRSAERHLRRKHSFCWSCRLELIMVRSMMAGHGIVWRSRDGARVFARAFGLF